MKIKPLNGKIIVKPDEAESKTVNGIIIPETSKEKPTYGIVVAASEEATDATVSVGVRVLYEQYVGTEVVLDNENLVIMSYDDIFGIIEE